MTQRSPLSLNGIPEKTKQTWLPVIGDLVYISAFRGCCLPCPLAEDTLRTVITDFGDLNNNGKTASEFSYSNFHWNLA